MEINPYPLTYKQHFQELKLELYCRQKTAIFRIKLSINITALCEKSNYASPNLTTTTGFGPRTSDKRKYVYEIQVLPVLKAR